jgi:alkylated DNA nucleotide flippase Atl1
MNQLLASLPTGRWTSYSDVAEVIGSHLATVDGWLSSAVVPNAHRVLKLDGRISPPHFLWPDPQRTDDPRKVLEAEGVRFDKDRADPEQRMTATDLAATMELDTNG